MNKPRSHPPRPLPVLTEVVEPPPPSAPEGSSAEAGGVPSAADAEFIGRVMRELELQVDLLLESRMREILAPAIARATDELLRETRGDLAALLEDVLSRALVQESSRTRSK